MAIRIRKIEDFGWVALCAAETDELPGDIYLDDGVHHALSAKFAQDWQGRTIDMQYDDEWAAMETQKLRDAREELHKWLAEIERLKDENAALEGCLELSGAAMQADGSVVVKMAKFNAMHRCVEHRKQDYKAQELEHCLICIRERLIGERANNIRLQIRAEDCGRPAHNFPEHQPRIDRSINAEVLARREIYRWLTAQRESCI